MKAIEGVPYSRESSAERVLDLFLPAAPGNGACILWIHGGGWYGGTRRAWHPVAQYFCERGFVCASADYRLAPEYVFPAQIEDVRLALWFLRTRAAGFGGAFRTLTVAGSSAGGHLAALLGTIGEEEALGTTPEMDKPPARPDAIVAYCPVTMVPVPCDPSGKMVPAVEGLMGDSAEAAPGRYRQASPVARVSGREPPVLFLHGDADTTVPLDHSLEMRRRLAAAGVTAELAVLPGVGHGFGYGVNTVPQKAAVKAVEAFLQQHLAVVGRRGTDAGETA